jgi:hypothetical protein
MFNSQLRFSNFMVLNLERVANGKCIKFVFSFLCWTHVFPSSSITYSCNLIELSFSFLCWTYVFPNSSITHSWNLAMWQSFVFLSCIQLMVTFPSFSITHFWGSPKGLFSIIVFNLHVLKFFHVHKFCCLCVLQTRSSHWHPWNYFKTLSTNYFSWFYSTFYKLYFYTHEFKSPYIF